MAETTPMMRQYLTAKEQYPGCLLFFRMGDFYEMFLDDAKVAAGELDLTLTSRDRNKPEHERTPMCGVPYHSADAYIARLVAKGYKVAICEQTEDPATAKGLVERAVVRVVTPGTVIDAAMLEEGRNNFIASVYADSQGAGVCFGDVSTGEVFVSSVVGPWREWLANELGRFSPREAVLSDGAMADEQVLFCLKERIGCAVEAGGEYRYLLSPSKEAVARQFKRGLDGMPQENAPIQAVGGLLSYLYETQKTDLSHLSALNYYTTDQFMELDLTARRNLELTETLRGKEKRGSLLWVLDKTKTAMGGRLLRAWIERPLLSPAPITRRLEAVKCLVGAPIVREEVALCLREIADMERLMGRIVYGTAGGRDLVELATSLGKVPQLRGLLHGLPATQLTTLVGQLDDLTTLREHIVSGLDDDPPFSVREGGFIRKGYHADVDTFRDLMNGAKDAVAAIETGERERTGIKSLKIGYNKVFGYYIEVSKSYYDQVPETYIRKQTLANCERFITEELKELEHAVLSAQDKLKGLEFELFTQLREETAAQVAQVQSTAAAVAQVDVLTAFATVAMANNYCMPQVELSDAIEIEEGRHPVVEKMLKNTLFVPNDTQLNGADHRLSIITGPNMAGKSTYMRQVALIVLMAQIGSFVPARRARIGVVDRVFTRIGASDDLAAGQSTFMVEMSEVATLLKYATPRSLLILDEIGRGTSTYDGMAIARGVLEFCADKKKLGCKTLFATHYHELTCLEEQLTGVKNYNIAAKKRQDDIVFLRKIIPGAADQSYGVEVAKLAGVPNWVVARAKKVLSELEEGGHTPAVTQQKEVPQLSMAELGATQVVERLRSTAVETLTPIEAMNLLYELKQRL